MSQATVDTMTSRYKDAYLVANVVVSFGGGIKVVGVLVAGAILLAGMVAANSLGTAVAVVCGILGAIGGAIIYIFGVLIAAQGQMQYAILDVAVNTSPILPAESKAELLLTASGTAAQPHSLRSKLEDLGV